MKKFLVLLAISMFTLAIASASDIPCIMDASSGTTFDNPVNGTTVIDCGPLTFDNFSVGNAVNGAINQVDVLQNMAGESYYDTGSGQAYLVFDPLLTSNQDEELLFEAWGGVNEIDMTVGGQNAVIQETACSAALTNGVCPVGDLLGQITVGSQEAAGMAGFDTTSPIYIFKNIQVGLGGELSAFTQSFGTVPEPISMVLLGSGLLGLGLLRRRSRKS